MTNDDKQYLAHARYLGADAAMAAATWIVGMSEGDATGILDDDPEVLDRYEPPNLSGEWADDPTPAKIAREVGANDGDIAFYGFDLLGDVAEAWESGRDEVWGPALEAHALRTLCRINDALRLERSLESKVDTMRGAAGL